MSHIERLSSFRGFSSIKLVRELDFHIVFCEEVIKITSLSLECPLLEVSLCYRIIDQSH